MNEPTPQAAVAAVIVHCPHCGQAHPVREQVLGRLARCTDCGQRFVLRLTESVPPSSHDPEAAPQQAPQPEPAPQPEQGPPLARASAPPVTPTAHAASPVVAPPHVAPQTVASQTVVAEPAGPPAPPVIEFAPPPPPEPRAPVAAAARSVSLRDDHWGVAGMVLAAFAAGLLIGATLLASPLFWAAWAAGLMASVFAKRTPLLIVGVALHLTLLLMAVLAAVMRTA
ncbi:MAG: hypothetical protein AAGJ46_06115 [Planctomycetota bacterium]